MRTKGIGGHTLPNRGRSDDWITPPHILGALGKFDLDPCCCREQLALHAVRCLYECGLTDEWLGRVWLNPPYGPETSKWLHKLAEHDHGTAIVFARTETRMFFESVWPKASAVLFIEGRLHFHYPDGTRAEANAGGPSVLIAYGEEDAWWLQFASEKKIPGKFIDLRKQAAPRGG